MEKNSLKNKIYRALEEHGEFLTVIDLIEYIKEPKTVAPSPHEVTHILSTSRQQGKISFKKKKNSRLNTKIRRSNDAIPTNIKLRR